jgi:hypothetical protein
VPSTSKKKSAKIASKTASKIAPKTGDAVTMVPEYPAQLPIFYSNFASVSHTGTEVSIDFCLLAQPYNIKSDENLVALVPAVAKVIIPPAMVSGLISALQSQEIKQKKAADSGQTLIPLSAIPK